MDYNILNKVQTNSSLSKNEIIDLLHSNDNELYSSANEIRAKYKGNKVHLRALIEYTNICKNDCLYCGLRCGNKRIDRYRLTEQQILECAKTAIKYNIKTIVLQGGEDIFFDADKICEIVKKIKQYDLAITLSLGERSYDEYKAFKQAGADRYLMRIETTDKELYKKLHPNMSFNNRVQCLYDLKEIGFETGTGCLVGLPNQSIESLADDILFFKELNADMIGIGPFIPHPDTPLAKEKSDNFDLALKVMAITRLILPDINIPATTAMESLKTNGRILALQAGANVIMPNITTVDVKGKYNLYPGKVYTDIQIIKSQINSIGREVSTSKGFRKD